MADVTKHGPDTFVDISSPGKHTPDPSSRPVIVTNRPVLTTDPMMRSGSGESPAESPTVSRHAKGIEPIVDTTAEPSTTPEVTDKTEASSENKLVDNIKSPASLAPDAPETAAPEGAADEAPEPAQDFAAQVRNDRAEAEDLAAKQIQISDAERKAETDRLAAIDRLIATGTYRLPINAIERKRSRTDTILLSVLALVLAVVLLDALLDTGIMSLPVSIPHTSFFSRV